MSSLYQRDAIMRLCYFYVVQGEGFDLSLRSTPSGLWARKPDWASRSNPYHMPSKKPSARLDSLLGAGRGIRTPEGISQQIYSLSCLTASLSLLNFETNLKVFLNASSKKCNFCLGCSCSEEQLQCTKFRPSEVIEICQEERCEIL